MVGTADSRIAMQEIISADEPRLRYIPHAGQMEVHQSTAKTKLVNCGRSWGKSMCVAGHVLAKAGVITIDQMRIGMAVDGPDYRNIKNPFPEPNPNLFAVLVAYTYKQAPVLWNALKDISPPRKVVKMNETTKEIEYEGGARVWLRSAENEDSVRSPHPDIWGADEFARIKPRVYFKEIAGGAITEGRDNEILGITTPKGMNFFYRMVKKILDEKDPDTFYKHATSFDSPYVSLAALNIEVKKVRDQFGDDAVREEFYAEFISDSGGVFQGLAKCIIPTPTRDPESRMPHYNGWDYAEVRDWSVLSAMDIDAEIRALDRFRGPLAYQIERAREFSRRAPGTIALDATGGGAQVLQMATAAGLPVRGVVLTAPMKQAIITALIGAISRGEIRIPSDQIALIEELESYAFERMPSGHVRYGAPEGLHDDCVVSVALANWERQVQGNYPMPGEILAGYAGEKVPPPPDPRCDHRSCAVYAIGCGCIICPVTKLPSAPCRPSHAPDGEANFIAEGV